MAAAAATLSITQEGTGLADTARLDEVLNSITISEI